jgi:hypothetical protein
MRSIISARQISNSIIRGFAVFGFISFVEIVWPMGIDLSWRIPLLMALIFFVVSFFAPESWR